MFLMYNYIIAIFTVPVKAIDSLSPKKALSMIPPFLSILLMISLSPRDIRSDRPVSFFSSQKENVLLFPSIQNGTQGVLAGSYEPVVSFKRVIERKQIGFRHIHITNFHTTVHRLLIHVFFLQSCFRSQ